MVLGVEIIATYADAGLHYCQGLHQRHSSQHKAALKAFNLARKDSHWYAFLLIPRLKISIGPGVNHVHHHVLNHVYHHVINLDSVVIGLLYTAYPDGCWHQFTFLPRLRPYPVRGHWLLYHVINHVYHHVIDATFQQRPAIMKLCHSSDSCSNGIGTDTTQLLRMQNTKMACQDCPFTVELPVQACSGPTTRHLYHAQLMLKEHRCLLFRSCRYN